jgi:hypothetical protein
MLSARDPLLTSRFSACRGLGEKEDGSFVGASFMSATESIDDKLALLPWLPRIAYDAALDRLLELSGASGVFGPERIDKAELRETIDGRITCEAPFRYDKCAHSFVGEGGRKDCPGAAVELGSIGSGETDNGDGVRAGPGFLASEIESAWKNLLSNCPLPATGMGGEGASALRTASSCLPFA